LDVVANPYIYYLAQVIGSIKFLTGGCSLLCFISALWSLTSIIDIKKVMEYNTVFKNENVNIEKIIEKNDKKSVKTFKYNITGVILVLVTLLIPSSETAYYILLNL
jgi:uncharacterized membrane protein YukC